MTSLDKKVMQEESKKVLFNHMYTDLDWLLHHNKNYTKEQYFRIDTLLDTLNSLKATADKEKELYRDHTLKSYVQFWNEELYANLTDEQVNNVVKRIRENHNLWVTFDSLIRDYIHDESPEDDLPF